MKKTWLPYIVAVILLFGMRADAMLIDQLVAALIKGFEIDDKMQMLRDQLDLTQGLRADIGGLDKLDNVLKLRQDGLKESERQYLVNAVRSQFLVHDRVNELDCAVRYCEGAEGETSKEVSQLVVQARRHTQSTNTRLAHFARENNVPVQQMESWLLKDAIVESHVAREIVQKAREEALATQKARENVAASLSGVLQSKEKLTLADLLNNMTQYDKLRVQQGEAILAALDLQTQTLVATQKILEEQMRLMQFIADYTPETQNNPAISTRKPTPTRIVITKSEPETDEEATPTP